MKENGSKTYVFTVKHFHSMTLSFNSSPNSTNLAIPKLCANGSNWANYAPQMQKAMGSKR